MDANGDGEIDSKAWHLCPGNVLKRKSNGLQPSYGLQPSRDGQMLVF